MLADVMINGEIVDLMTETLSQKIEADRATKEYKVIALKFMDELKKAWKERKKTPANMGKILTELASCLKVSKLRNLLFPVHLQKEKHYVGFKIDFREKEISYGI
jgi:hypothetical protein